MQTRDLVHALVADAQPVSRLPPPMLRAASWLAGSIAYLALIVAAVGPRPDLADKLGDMRFALEVGAGLATGALAAAAAFCAGCPGRPLWERFAPLPALVVWLASLGEGCWRAWLYSGPTSLSVEPDFLCLPYIVVAGLLPAMLILVMVRKGAPVAPFTTMMLATLAAAALSAAALRLFHAQDASITVLVWQFGSVILLAALGSLSGRQLLRWPEPSKA